MGRGDMALHSNGPSFLGEIMLNNKEIEICEGVMNEIKDTIGRQRAETGGLLLGPLGGPITHFYFDDGADCGYTEYTPDVATLNDVMSRLPADLRLKGFVHSHPPGCIRLSSADREYADRILQYNNTLPELILPIVQTMPDTGAFKAYGYRVRRQFGRLAVSSASVRIVDDVQSANEFILPRNKMFDRVVDAYDLNRMSNSMVVIAGTGGSASFVEDICRAGVSNLVLVDFDTVAETNVATQRYYHSEIGMQKVEVLANRVLDVNPSANVRVFAEKIEDVCTNDLQRLLFCESYDARLIVSMTDSFEAQATCNKLALRFGIPHLAAQMYAEGRAAEVVFSVPGSTPACVRCALSARYDHYESGYDNDTTSHGSPIFSGEQLNGFAGALAIAILHHGTDHPRWGGIVERAGNRSLVQLRFDPDAGNRLGLTVFENILRPRENPEIYFGDTIWRSVLPDNPDNGFPNCPDCEGTGKLPNSQDTITKAAAGQSE